MPAYVGVWTAYSAYDQRTLRMTSVLCVWPAYSAYDQRTLRMTSVLCVWPAYSAYDQRTLRMTSVLCVWPAYSAYDQRTLRMTSVLCVWLPLNTRYSIVRHTPRCPYTLQIRQTYFRSMVLIRYQYASCMVLYGTSSCQRMSTVLDLWVTYLYRTSSVISVCLAYA